MAIFHLYQRVRVVAIDPDAPSNKNLIGREGHIIGSGDGLFCRRQFEYAVRLDGIPCKCGFDGYQLEPIKHQPDALDLMTVENAPSFDCPVVVAA